MKIAVWYNLPSGGAKRALFYHINGLLKQGHTIEAWCPPTADRTYLPLKELVNERVVPLNWRRQQSHLPMIAGLVEYSTKMSLLKAMDQHCRQCASEINAGNFDLLFASACMFLGTPFIGRYVKIPKVVYLQEPYRRLYEALPELPWIAIPPLNRWSYLPRHIKYVLGDALRNRQMRIQAREELQNARAFDSILVNSLFTRESILRAYGLDAKVCYLGIDTVLFYDQHKSREDFVVGLGAFTPQKNILLVIEALANVRPPAPRLVWIGNDAHPSYLAVLEQAARTCAVNFQAKVGVPDSELVDILNRAAMLVYPPRLEPFGLAPLEANACGLPVIAVAEGGVRESVIDGVNGVIVESDPKAIARAIEWLRDNPNQASRLSEQGRKLLEEKWTWDSAIDRLEHRLAEAVEVAQRRQTSTVSSNA